MMRRAEYSQKIFQQQTTDNSAESSTGLAGFKKTSERLAIALNVACERRKQILKRLPDEKDLPSKPEFHKVRDELEKVAKQSLPLAEKGLLRKEILADVLFEVGNLYQEEVNLNLNVFTRSQGELVDKPLSALDPERVTANYGVCAGLAGKINNLQTILKISKNQDLQKRTQKGLLDAHYHFLVSCLGVIVEEADPIYRPVGQEGGVNFLLELVQTRDKNSLRRISRQVEGFTGINNQLHLIKVLIETLQSARERLKNINEVLPVIRSSMDVVKESRDHFLALANLMFELTTEAGAASQPNGSAHTVSLQACFSKIFKLSIYAVDSLDYLIEQAQLSMKQTRQLPASAAGSSSASRPMQPVKPPITAASRIIQLEMAEASSSDEEAEIDRESDLSLQDTDEAGKLKSASRNMLALLEKNPFPGSDFYMDKPGTGFPDTVVHTLKTEVAHASRLIEQLQNRRQQLAESSPDQVRFTEKINFLQRKIEEFQSPDLHTHLFKSYRFPQARHWLELIRKGEIESVKTPKKPINSASDKVYEVEIKPKATGSLGNSPSVWLHIHVKDHVKKNLQAAEFCKPLANPSCLSLSFS